MPNKKKHIFAKTTALAGSRFFQLRCPTFFSETYRRVSKLYDQKCEGNNLGFVWYALDLSQEVLNFCPDIMATYIDRFCKFDDYRNGGIVIFRNPNDYEIDHAALFTPKSESHHSTKNSELLLKCGFLISIMDWPRFALIP